MRELHAERNGDAQHLLTAFRLEQLHDSNRHAVFQPAVFSDDADLLVVGVGALAANLHPRRIHQLRLVTAGLLLAGLRRLLCGLLCGLRRGGLFLRWRRFLRGRLGWLLLSRRGYGHKRYRQHPGKSGGQRPAQRPGRCDPMNSLRLVPCSSVRGPRPPNDALQPALSV